MGHQDTVLIGVIAIPDVTMCIATTTRKVVIPVGQRPGRRGRIIELGKMRTFLTLGGKVAATIGAGGPVATPGPGEFAIREAEKASVLMASAYDIETGAIEAIEMPGYHWIIGVAWPLHHLDLLPARFDNILASFVERSIDA